MNIDTGTSGREMKTNETEILGYEDAESKQDDHEDLPNSESQTEQDIKASVKDNVRMEHEEDRVNFNSHVLEKQEPTTADLHESYLECRICRCRDDEPLISPCNCSGSSKWIHQSCLVQWFQISRTSKCEVCSEKIIIKKFLKPIREWKRPASGLGSCTKVDLWYAFVTLFSIGTIIGFAIFHSYIGAEEGLETTVVFIAIYILCTFMIALRVRYFYQWFTRRNPFWDEWRVLNQEWNIQQEGSVQPETTRFIIEESTV